LKQKINRGGSFLFPIEVIYVYIY